MRITVGLALLGLMAGCVSPLPDSRSPDGLAGRAAAVNADGQPLSAFGDGSSVDTTPTMASEAAGISDEQDFAAVSARESIESDAARLEGYRANYQQVQPEAVPDRPSGNSASIVQFALSTTNSVGQPLYQRSGLSGDARARRNCSRYTSADFAQIAFLESGGPKRDRYGIDPDGDGFACAWDPAPFRAARGVAATPTVTTESVSAAELEAIGITTEPATVPAPTQPAPVAPPAPAQPVPLPGNTLNISTE
ncbi:hypothetical protein ALP8811_02337 [Aliiroseovarius pelagivivens]|uniref:Excalibur calcium-binding domain-containing protein n=1 Tax=Aliiroseovarius pelagivivens TaxID=1639690 RepID=A0A2R8AMS8_9RHOB|nr:hypothetical protein [Aliiroseovarius pelagivivens]SPF77310.1 hypothetical protein ALP8811_02337 [Aliiroseovarius pelagivivens]